MSKDKTGGPAFPFPAYTYPNGEINHGEGGMTLRDYFAAKAMQGLLSADDGFTMGSSLVAELAYDQADAMLKERGV